MDINKFIKKLNDAVPYENASTTFQNFCECAAIALQNSVLSPDSEEFQRREKRYLSIAQKYGTEIMLKLSDLLADLLRASTEKIEDNLGKVYMQLGGNKYLDQNFTPDHIAKLMAAITQEGFSDPQHVLDPCCGSGSLILGQAAHMADQNIDYQKNMIATAVDVDPHCVYMTYIQLSILGIRAKVICGNSLSNTVYDVWYTPACYTMPTVQSDS